MKDTTMGPIETCSWCTAEVLDSTLREIIDGSRLCKECWRDARAGIMP